MDWEDKIFDLSLEEIWRRIETDTLSKDFLVFDNFEQPIDEFKILESSPFPIRINLTVIIFCTEGFMKIKVGVNEYVLSENKFLIILTNQIFQLVELSPDFKAGFLLLKDEFLLDQNDIRSTLFNIGQVVTLNACFALPKRLMEEEVFLFKSIRNVIKQKDNKFRPILVHHYFRIMFYHVCYVFFSEQEKITQTRSRQDEVFYRFIRDVDTHFYAHRSIKYYADKASLTPKYFSKLIADVSGKKASDWIDEYVVLEAKTLLKNTTMTIQEISNALNFSNQSHFSRYFCAHTGISPNAYRRT